MKIIHLFLLLSALSCNKFILKAERITPPSTPAPLPREIIPFASYWLDANEVKTITEFRQGIPELSAGQQDCLSDQYPKIETVRGSGHKVFRGERGRELSCHDIDLSFLSQGQFTVYLAFVPTSSPRLLTLSAGTEIFSVFLMDKVLMVSTGADMDYLSQHADYTFKKNQISLLKLVIDLNETAPEDRQKIWINGASLPLVPQFIGSGTFSPDTSEVHLHSQSGTEISSLMIFDHILTQEQETQVNCYLSQKLELNLANCQG